MSIAVIKDVFWYFASAISIQNRDSVLNLFLISLQMRTFSFNCILRNMNIPRTLKIQSTLWTHKTISLRMNSQEEVQTANHKCSGKFKDFSYFYSWAETVNLRNREVLNRVKRGMTVIHKQHIPYCISSQLTSTHLYGETNVPRSSTLAVVQSLTVSRAFR